MKKLLSLVIGILFFQFSFSMTSLESKIVPGLKGSLVMNYGFIPHYPSAETDSATLITTDSAVLNGTVLAYGFNVVVSFEWGLTPSYGNTVTASQSPVSGFSPNQVSYTLKNLELNTTYYYRVVAYYDSTTTYGFDMSFTTAAIAPMASTDSASSISTSGAILHGMVNANNDITYVTVDWGIDTAYGNKAIADQSPVFGVSDTAITYTLTDLESFTTYHYRIVAVNSVDTTFGSDMTIDILGIPPEVITQPATSITASGATLNGDVSTNDDIDPVQDGDAKTVVYFEWGTTSTYGYIAYADQNPLIGRIDTSVTYSLSNLYPNTMYHFRVVAINSIDTSFGSDVYLITNRVAPKATTAAASSISTNSASINGDVNANNDYTTVYFDWDTSTTYNHTNIADQSPVNGLNNSAVTFALTKLKSRTSYHYRVVAYNSGGTTYGYDDSFTTKAIAPYVTTTAATSITTGTATINGYVNSNNDNTNITFEFGTTTAYGNSASADESPLSGISDESVSYNLPALIANTTYHYRVVATNFSGTTYGSDVYFTTNNIVWDLKSLPILTTNNLSSVTKTSAISGGIITDDGNLPILKRGICWGLSPNPDISLSTKTDDGTGSGSFSSEMSNLIYTSTYYIRAYAVNSLGVSYGNEVIYSRIANSIESPVSANLIHIYSNSKNAYIKLGSFDNTSNGQIEIFNCLGKEVITQKITNDLSIIDLAFCTRGYYIIRVIRNNNITCGKIFIE